MLRYLQRHRVGGGAVMEVVLVLFVVCWIVLLVFADR